MFLLSQGEAAGYAPCKQSREQQKRFALMSWSVYVYCCTVQFQCEPYGNAASPTQMCVWKHKLNNGKKLPSTTTTIIIAIRQQSNAVEVPGLNGLFV